jgi:hypothetical protein
LLIALPSLIPQFSFFFFFLANSHKLIDGLQD